MGYDFGLFRPTLEPELQYVPPTALQKPDLTLGDMPPDVLYLISDHLDAPAAYSLSLTCRGFYQIGLPQAQKKLRADEQTDLLTTLERDSIGSELFFCPPCTKLHAYKKNYGPRSIDERLDKSQGHICGMKNAFSPTGNPFDLGYHHARLVMNAHLYGPSRGTPLGSLCVKHEARRDRYTVQCSTAANIIDDELFLRRTYSFTIDNADVGAFRRCTGQRDFRICEHLPFFRNSSAYNQAIPELQRRPHQSKGTGAGSSSSASGDAFVRCKSSPGSCGICLLDYDITIDKVPSATGAKGDAWAVTIEAYHQLGDCRSPQDWKWARFTEKTRPGLFLPCRPNRRGSSYRPGAVKRTWAMGAAAHGVADSCGIAQLKRHSI